MKYFNRLLTVNKVCSDGEDFYLLLLFNTIVKINRSGEIVDIYELDFGRYKDDPSCFGLDFDVHADSIVLLTGNMMVLLFEK